MIIQIFCKYGDFFLDFRESIVFDFEPVLFDKVR